MDPIVQYVSNNDQWLQSHVQLGLRLGDAKELTGRWEAFDGVTIDVRAAVDITFRNLHKSKGALFSSHPVRLVCPQRAPPSCCFLLLYT